MEQFIQINDTFNETIESHAFRIRFSSPTFFILCIIGIVSLHVFVVIWAVMNTIYNLIHPTTLRISAMQKALSSVLFLIFSVLGITHEENLVLGVLSLLFFEMLLYSSVQFYLCSVRLRLPREPWTREKLSKLLSLLLVIFVFTYSAFLVLHTLFASNYSEEKFYIIAFLILFLMPTVICSWKSWWDVASTLILEVHVGEFHVANLTLMEEGWELNNTELGTNIGFQWPRNCRDYFEVEGDLEMAKK